MTTAAISSCPFDVRFDLDEALSTMCNEYWTRQRTIKVNSLIARLPTLMENEAQLLEEDKICTICREDISTRDQIGRQLVCRHIYHEHCIASWLALDSSCPLCRCVVIPNVVGHDPI